MSDSRTANVLIAVTARLIDLMNREIQLLKSMRPKEIETLQSEKAALVQEYDEHIRNLREEPECVIPTARFSDSRGIPFLVWM